MLLRHELAYAEVVGVMVLLGRAEEVEAAEEVIPMVASLALMIPAALLQMLPIRRALPATGSASCGRLGFDCQPQLRAP